MLMKERMMGVVMMIMERVVNKRGWEIVDRHVCCFV